MNKKKSLIIGSLLLAALLLTFTSCYTDYGLSTADYDTIITLFDNNANFKKPTYAMPDTVVHFVEEGEEDDIDRSKDALILQTIENNMTKLGYAAIQQVLFS
jgi:hypothetical protein